MSRRRGALITLDESVGMAFLIVLDSMSPAQRVAFVLHDVFRYPSPEVARIAGRLPPAGVHGAPGDPHRAGVRRHVDGAGRGRRTRAQAGNDVGALIRLLDPEVTAVGDGGGVVRTLEHPLRGREPIVRGLLRFGPRQSGQTLLERTVNGRPGLVGCQDGAVLTVYSFGVSDHRVRHLWAMRNPEKLRSWATVAAA
ncbi:hypothetical protein ACFWGR_02315 [Streptomyces sp. NPDC060311]|uniref:hypothetical protein n=1 Tax=Streptomyces sp. NPDC060311 TaxID=3347096 RepID=UPI00365766E0